MRQLIERIKQLIVNTITAVLVVAGALWVLERGLERAGISANVVTAAVQQPIEANDETAEAVELTPEQLADREALLRGINPALVRAVMHVESRGKADAVSIKGAVGLLQVMPANYKRCGLPHPGKLWEPDVNVACGTQILAEELKNHKLDDALRVYNGGPRALKRGFKESEQYVVKVINQLMVELDKEVRG
jgi:soluble lytic murein transglycosylase-like protein